MDLYFVLENNDEIDRFLDSVKNKNLHERIKDHRIWSHRGFCDPDINNAVVSIRTILNRIVSLSVITINTKRELKFKESNEQNKRITFEDFLDL